MLSRNQKPSKTAGSKTGQGASRSEAVSSRDPLPWRQISSALAVVSVAVVILLLWAPLMNWVNRPIARVEVHSTFENLGQNQVEERLAPWLVNRFFHLNLVEMQDAVVTMPWVRAASLRREWPDKLVIKLEEQAPIARWLEKGLIGDNGQVFEPESIVGFDRLPKLSGPSDRAKEVMQQYLAISQILRPSGLTVNALGLSETDAWWFKVDHVEVNIGRDRRMERLQRFIRLYHARLDRRWQEVARVDLRYLNGAAVAWKKDAERAVNSTR